ncbi:MAG: EamA family transporter [Nakamurella sp.]
MLPLLIVVGAAASWAVGNTLTRGVEASGLSLTIWSGLVVPVPLALMSVIFEGPTAMVDAVARISVGGILAVAYTVLGASLVGYGIWNTLLSKYPTASVGPFAMLVPVVGVLAAWIALDELPTPTEAIGAVILLIGVAATVVLGRRRTRLSARSGRSSTGIANVAAEHDTTAPVGAVRHSGDAPVWDTGDR